MVEPADLRRLPAGWWQLPTIVFLASRVISAALLFVGAARQVSLDGSDPGMHVFYPIPSSPSYWQVMGNWDAQWFHLIADEGYPREIPRQDGRVMLNPWPFLPVFPMLARALMATGLSFEVAGSTLSAVASGIAILVIYRLVYEVGGRSTAFLVVLGVCVFPSTAILQVPYADGLAFLLVALILFNLFKSRYVLTALLIAVLSLTRSLVLPIGGVIALLWLLHWRRRRVTPSGNRHLVGLGLNLAWCAVAAVIWPLIADLATGSSGAYVSTMAAWPVNSGALGPWGGWVITGFLDGFAPGFLSVALAGFFLFLPLRREGKFLGVEVRAWIAIYTLYIFVATLPSPSSVRYFLLGPAFLILLPGSIPPPGRGRVGIIVASVLLVALSLVGQYFWVMRVFTVAVSPAVQPFP